VFGSGRIRILPDLNIFVSGRIRILSDPEKTPDIWPDPDPDPVHLYSRQVTTPACYLVRVTDGHLREPRWFQHVQLSAVQEPVESLRGTPYILPLTHPAATSTWTLLFPVQVQIQVQPSLDLCEVSFVPLGLVHY